MPHERLPKQTLYAEVSGKRPVKKSRTRWLDYIEDLGWNRLGLYPSEMQSVLVDREVWRLNLKQLPPQKLVKKKKEDSFHEFNNRTPALYITSQNNLIDVNIKARNRSIFAFKHFVFVRILSYLGRLPAPRQK